MRVPLIVATALLLTSCSTSEERQQRALMDQIEEQVQLPKGAGQLGDYARYYTHGDNGDVRGVYLIPFNDEPRSGEGCDELSANLESRDAPCPPMQSRDALRAGERRWVDDSDMPFIDDGGCAEVNVTFDKSKSAVTDVSCNAER